MARVLCKYSGIEYTCEHLPIRLYSREVSHPIFSLSPKKLYGIYSKYLTAELTDTESYLLYLAFLHDTELLDFRVPAVFHSHTPSIIANNISQLVTIFGRIQEIRHPAFACAKVAVTAENKDLANSGMWISIWHQNYKDFCDGYRKQEQLATLRKREQWLESRIKDSNRDIGSYAKNLAKWAADAASFSELLGAQITSPLSRKQCTIGEYYQEIIIACTKSERIFDIPKADIEELIEHLETYMSGGSIYSHALYQLLKNGLKRNRNLLGFADIDISDNSYRILSASETVEDANKMAIIDNAPKEMPRPEMYPSRIAYIRAKLAYQMALAYNKDKPQVVTLTELAHTTAQDVPSAKPLNELDI